MRPTTTLLSLSALLLAPGPARAWGLLVPEDGACARVASYEAELSLAPAGVATRVRIALDPADPAAPAPALLLPGGVAPPEVLLDGVRQPVELVPADDALDLLVDLAAARGDPSVLALAGADLYRVEPGGSGRVLELTGVRPLDSGSGVLHLDHPLRPGQTWCGPAARLSVQVELPGMSGRTLAGVFSPYHDLAVTRHPDGGITARAEEERAWPAFDFHLYAVVAGGPVGASLMAWREPSCGGEADDGTFALVAAPSGVGGPEALPKDLVLVLDTSGSMAGEKLEQARRAAAYVLEHLGPGDRFDVLGFDDEVSSLFGGLAEVAPDTLAQAMSFARGLAAGGATNIHDALLEATGTLSGGPGGRPSLVVFVTDGQATEGVTDRDAIIAAIDRTDAQAVRIFPFGVGYDVDTFLLDGLAAAHGGVSSYVHPGQDIAAALAGFYDRVHAPVMTGLSLDAEGVRPWEVLPRALPDLYDSGQLVVVGRYTDAASGSLALSGDLDGDSRPDRVLPDGRLVRSGTVHAWLPRLWAAREVADLIALDRRAPGDEDVVERIRSLARRYGISSPFTSFYRDDQGNVRDAYAPPTGEATGERSVGDSDAVNAMNADDNAARYGGDAALAGLLRHLDDRTFLGQDGAWVDTSVDPGAPVVELRFGSPVFRRYLAHEPGLGRYLSVARRVVFRYGCLTFSVGDDQGDDPEAPAPPPETSEAPEGLLAPPLGGVVWMDPAGDGPAERQPEAETRSPQQEAGEGEGEGEAPEPDDGPGMHSLCAVADPAARPGAWSLVLLLLVLGRGMVRAGWTGSASRRCISASAPSSSAGRPRS